MATVAAAVSPPQVASRSGKISKLEDVTFIEGDRIDVQRVVAGQLDYHKVIFDLIENHGPVMQFYIRDQLVLVVNDPVLVKQVFEEAKMKIPLNNKLNTILHRASSKDDSRKSVYMRTFHSSFKKFKDEKKDVLLSNRLRSVLNMYSSTGFTVPMSDVFGSFALDYVYNLLFGIDKNFMENMYKYTELRETIEYLFDNFEHSPSALFEEFLSSKVFDHSIFKTAFFCVQWRSLRNHCKDLLQELTEVHRFAAEDDTTFAPTFLRYVKTMGWEENDILQELSVFMLAGHETTANAMCWIIFDMATHEHLQEQCRAIVHPYFDPSVPRPAFKLEHVIQESMRVHPVVSRPMLRTSDEDISLKLEEDLEVTAPPGVGFLVNFYALHNSTLNWRDPEVFDPERHMDLPAGQKLFEDGTRRGEADQEGLRFVPFSFGERRCPGEKIAYQEMQFVLEVLAEYEFAFADMDEKFKPRHLSELSNVTMRPSKDVQVQVTRLIVPPESIDELPMEKAFECA